MSKAQFGMIGLGVMGRNFLLNVVQLNFHTKFIAEMAHQRIGRIYTAVAAACASKTYHQ